MFRFAWPLFVSELVFLPPRFDEAWYNSLQKASFHPPSYLFGLAWGGLYPLLAYTYYLLLEMGDESALILFESQLALNLAWSHVFFTLKNIQLSTLLLILMILLNVSLYKRFPRKWYLIYIGWLSFALVLTLSLREP
jgi:tryptophan-rich sensory protein